MARKTVQSLADAMAAAKVRGIDPATIQVMSADDAARIAAKAATDAATASAVTNAATAYAHGCGIPGCTHGTTKAGHGTTQPDRQVKLECPTCGAVARMTAKAIHRAGGMPTCADGTPMVAGTRRTYTRKAVAA